MKISALGEFGLIRRFSPPFLRGLGRGVLGIGDDCAVIPWRKNAVLLVTTDMLLEGVHFLRDKISPDDLGYKSLAVNLSDIAAMGGVPFSAFLSVGLTPDVSVAWADGFFRGLGKLARASGVQLLGGDTTRSERHLAVNIAVIGRAHPARIKRRASARLSDVIAVTGRLGDSAGGLRILLEGRRLGREEKRLVSAHVSPRPQIEEGVWLARHSAVRAMMDVSDGIDSDLRRIMESSKCGASVNLERLPLSRSLRAASRRYGWEPLSLAAAGGEDYCLLVTVAPGDFPRLAALFKKRFRRPLSAIGTVMNRKNGLRYRIHGHETDLPFRGYDHFASKRSLNAKEQA